MGQSMHHSPLPIEATATQECSDDGVATVPATPATVKITVDDVDAGAGPQTYIEETSLATPFLGMSGSFSYVDASSPPANFIEPWQNVPTYPFTFTAEPQSPIP